jgi:hypothetical protein
MRKIQQIYRLLINGVDATENIVGDVVVESQPDVLNSLNIVLQGGSYLTKGYQDIGQKGEQKDALKLPLAHVVKLQDKVVCEGGTLEGFENRTNYAVLFVGFVKYLRPSYSDSGIVTVALECVDYTFKAATNKIFNVYPCPNGVSEIKSSPLPNATKIKVARSWGTSGKIKASEIIRNISNDMKVPIALDADGKEDLKLLVDREYTSTACLTQKNETDWQLLRKLGNSLNCNVWTSINSKSQTVLHFVDKSLLMESLAQKTEFLYPAKSSNFKDFIYKNLKPNQKIVFSCSVEHDYANIDAVSRKVTIFDYKKGLEVTVFEAKITENGKEITKYFTYEIDEAKTNALSEEQRKYVQDVAGSIAGDAVSSHSINEIAEYFIPATFIDEKKRNFIVDKPYFGITIKLTCDGDVNILPRKNYNIYGLGRYGSETLESPYYCKVVKHVFSTNGFLTELEFIK